MQHEMFYATRHGHIRELGGKCINFKPDYLLITKPVSTLLILDSFAATHKANTGTCSHSGGKGTPRGGKSNYRDD